MQRCAVSDHLLLTNTDVALEGQLQLHLQNKGENQSHQISTSIGIRARRMTY
jgi:hypothetical protein